jgi:hypothetical protein
MRMGMEFKFGRIGNGVDSAFRERPAAKQPLQRKPNAAARAVHRHGLLRVHGARWIELAASAKERRKEHPVELNGKEQKSASDTPGCSRRRYERGGVSLCGSVRSSSASSEANSAFATITRG